MTTPLFNRITTFAAHHNLLPAGTAVILGLSGGPDSLFLLHYLAPLHTAGTIKLIAAHLDHEWRADSAMDVEFCRRATATLGVPFVASTITELGIEVKNNGSQEELGRAMRRAFFERVRTEHNADVIALAHHADDQQETFFIRLLRGASLAGLTGMKPRHGAYIRPLLEISKADIVAWLETHGIAYLTDPTNRSDNYLRNRIRKYVLPALQESDARFTHNFERTLEQLQQTEAFLEHLTQETFANISTFDNNTHRITINQFLKLHGVLQQRILLHWLCAAKVAHTPSQGFFNELIRFIKYPAPGTHAISTQWNLVKKGGYLWLEKQA
jgi:tRNA(Ile)-lysidine synthase